MSTGITWEKLGEKIRKMDKRELAKTVRIMVKEEFVPIDAFVESRTDEGTEVYLRSTQSEKERVLKVIGKGSSAYASEN